MFPMRYRTIFKSRWWALIWGAGILWTAYDFASAQPQSSATDNNAAAAAGPIDGSGATITPEDAQNLNEALNEF
jgi:hypothetical protein